MTTLEKILQEIDNLKKLYSENGLALMDKGNLPCEYDSSDIESEKVKAISEVMAIIQKHLSCENHTETTRQSQNDMWIPCDPENMPDKEVMCCDKYGELLIGWLSNTNLGYVCESEECTMYDVVAWMEKPKPYKPPVESAEEKSMREREEFFEGTEFFENRFNEMK